MPWRRATGRRSPSSAAGRATAPRNWPTRCARRTGRDASRSCSSSQATAEGSIGPADNYPVGYVPPQLIKLYDRSFRFCFTNKQMAEAVTDFVFDRSTGPSMAGLRGRLRAGTGPAGWRQCACRHCRLSPSPGRTMITRSTCRGSSARRDQQEDQTTRRPVARHDRSTPCPLAWAASIGRIPRGNGGRTDPSPVAAAGKQNSACVAHGERAGPPDAARSGAGEPGRRQATRRDDRRRHRREYVLP